MNACSSGEVRDEEIGFDGTDASLSCWPALCVGWASSGCSRIGSVLFELTSWRAMR